MRGASASSSRSQCFYALNLNLLCFRVELRVSQRVVQRDDANQFRHRGLRILSRQPGQAEPITSQCRDAAAGYRAARIIRSRS